MAIIDGTVKGVSVLREAEHALDVDVFEVSVALGAYVAASDSGRVPNLAATIDGFFRDSRRTTEIVSACHYAPGYQRVTDAHFESSGHAVASGAVTFNLTDATGAEVSAPLGVQTRPLRMVVVCRRIPRS